MLVPNAQAAQAGLHPPDAGRFAQSVLLAEEDMRTCGVSIVHAPSELVGPRLSSCPMGNGMLVLTPDGALQTCYLSPSRWHKAGLDLSVGTVDGESGVSIDQSKFNSISDALRHKPRCAKCFCRHTCAGGCHVDQTPPGCQLAYDERCMATRMITAGRLVRRLEGTSGVRWFVNGTSTMKALAEWPDDRLAAWTSTQKTISPGSAARMPD